MTVDVNPDSSESSGSYDSQRWFKWKNYSKSTCPAFGAIQLPPFDSSDTDPSFISDGEDEVWRGKRTNALGEHLQNPALIAFNGYVPVPPGGTGHATRDFPCQGMTSPSVMGNFQVMDLQEGATFTNQNGKLVGDNRWQLGKVDTSDSGVFTTEINANPGRAWMSTRDRDDLLNRNRLVHDTVIRFLRPAQMQVLPTAWDLSESRGGQNAGSPILRASMFTDGEYIMPSSDYRNIGSSFKPEYAYYYRSGNGISDLDTTSGDPVSSSGSGASRSYLYRYHQRNGIASNANDTWFGRISFDFLVREYTGLDDEENEVFVDADELTDETIITLTLVYIDPDGTASDTKFCAKVSAFDDEQGYSSGFVTKYQLPRVPVSIPFLLNMEAHSRFDVRLDVNRSNVYVSPNRTYTEIHLQTKPVP